MWYKGPVSFFCTWIFVSPTPSVEDTILSPLCSLCWRLVKHICESLFLGSLFCSSGVNICLFSIRHLWLSQLYNILWNQQVWSFQLCIISQIALPIQDPLEKKNDNFWWLSAFLGLWPHHSYLCLSGHIVFSSFLSVKFPFASFL